MDEVGTVMKLYHIIYLRVRIVNPFFPPFLGCFGSLHFTARTSYGLAERCDNGTTIATSTAAERVAKATTTHQ